MVMKGKKLRAAALAKSKDYQGFFDELRGESDRAAAIIAASFLDEHLKQLLSNYFVDDEKETTLLLSSESSLGTFGSRIRAAYCMGLIPKDWFQALKLIKDIRNAFAHQLHGRSFSDQDITQACEELKSLMPLKAPVPQTPRMMFESAAIFILMDVTVRALSIVRKRCRMPPRSVVHEFFV